MRADSQSLSVSLTFASPREATLFFLRPLVARGSFAACAAMEQLRASGRVDWEAANAAARRRQAATAVVEEDLRPEPETFRVHRGLTWEHGVCFGGGRGRSEMILRGQKVLVGARGVAPTYMAQEEVADAIAGRLLGGLAPWQQPAERAALARKILALWAKDKKDRAAEADRAAEEERRARRSGVTVEVYRERLARAARRSGRAGSGGKKGWDARRRPAVAA